MDLKQVKRCVRFSKRRQAYFFDFDKNLKAEKRENAEFSADSDNVEEFMTKTVQTSTDKINMDLP